MSFLNPWVAAAVASVVIPTLVILYFLKLRRREEVVPSTLLWKRAVQDLQVNAPFQRLRKNLLLFLQLLILALAILALARPLIQTEVAREDRVVLLVDRSASMNAIEEHGQTRLELAKEQATRLVKTLNRRSRGWRSFLTLGAAEARSQVMVIAFAERAEIVSPFTTNASDLVALIEGIRPSDGLSDMKEAVELAAAYMAPPTMTTDKTPVSSESPAKLVLISDGRVANLEKLVLKSGTLELLQVGDAADNVGITALRCRRNYEQPELVDVFLAVRNFGPQPVDTDVSIFVDERLEAVQHTTLGALESPAAAEAATGNDNSEAAPAPPIGDAEPSGVTNASTVSFTIPLDRAALLEARLSRGDALAVDNRAWIAVPPPRKLRVLVVTADNPLIDFALSGQPLAEYPFVSLAEYEANDGRRFYEDNQSKFDVVVFDKLAPQRLPAGSYLFLAAVPPLAGFAAEAKQEWFNLLWWDEAHPVLRHVQLSPVVVSSAIGLKIPEAAEVLMEGPRGPMLARYASEGRHCLVMGFAPEMSPNWWSTGFPVFLYNAVRYLGGGIEAVEGPQRPGSTLTIPVPPGHNEVRLRRPDGLRTSLRADVSGQAYYGDTDVVGVYRAEDGVAGRDRYAINLEDDWESDIRPPTATLKVGSQVVARLGAIRTATPEVWRWFVGAALVLVLLEWWVYNRRVMI